MPRKNAAQRSNTALAADAGKKPSGLREISPKPITAKSAASTRPLNPHWNTGSWRGKAPAVSGISSNDATVVATPDLPGHNRSASTSAPRLSRTLTMGKSGPAIATPTKLNVTTNGRGDIMNMAQEDEMERVSLRQEKDVSAPPRDERDTVEGGGEVKEQQEVTSNSLWSGWFGTTSTDLPKVAVPDEAQDVPADQEEQNDTTRPHAASDNGPRKQSIPPPEAVPLSPDSEPRQQPEEAGNSMKSTRSARPRSWLGLWSGSVADAPSEAKESTTEGLETQSIAAPKSAAADTATAEEAQSLGPITSKPNADNRSSWFGLWSGATTQISNVETTTSDQTAEAQVAAPPVAVGPQDSPAPEVPVTSAPGYASWAYWSGTQGETRVAAQSEAEPEQPATAETISTPSSKQSPAKTSTPVSNMSSASSVAAISAAMWEGVSLRAQPNVNATSGNEQRLETENVEAMEAATVKDVAGSERRPPNLVLPRVQDTFVKAEPVTYKGQLWSIGRSALARTVSRRASLSNPQHVNLQATPARLKRAVVIGVHGFFPTIPMWRKVFGPPTGTSVRFAHGAAAAIESWTKAQGYSCDIEKVALEGEGMIADRLENLWKLLSSSLAQIAKADLVVIASHSQGVPVSMMLMARLLEGGHVSSQARLAVTAMAGISLGPFSSLQSRFLSPPASVAGELFAFATVTSTVSTAYTSALRTCLSHTPNAVRVALIGSIDDQLVSLESSLFNTVSHPYIFRAVFVDGNIHAPNFLTHLVAFALKVRNLGGSDHGLIRELSNPLAGSLYGGAGHSTIYQEQAVYDLGISWALDSADLPLTHRPELVIQADYEPATAASNPYLLPWALRGLLEEDVVKTKLQEEAKELVRQFDEWKPVTKVLKDVKFRLEAVKTKL